VVAAFFIKFIFVKTKPMKRLVILTGAGISTESGIKTFRDSDGLWNNYRFEDLASPDAWENNRQAVLEFYNMRRKQLLEVAPNDAHKALVKLEACYQTTIITQNVDDLHERAGSSDVVHLHGELRKARSTKNPYLIYDLKGWELKEGDTCELGSQLRPHVVWFGEPVPMFEKAVEITSKADVFIIIGTSLKVYPAAGLVHYTKPGIPVYLIDPKASPERGNRQIEIIRKKAGDGVPPLVEQLLEPC
jgi:NAD-dependent deacetylase